MKCKTCGFNNELHTMQFCGLNCAEKGYFKQAEQIEQYVKISYMSRVEIAKLKTELDASQTSHKALETLYLQVRDEDLAGKDKEIARLQAEITGCIQRLDEGDFPDGGCGTTELERKLDEACINNDQYIARLKEENETLRDRIRDTEKIDDGIDFVVGYLKETGSNGLRTGLFLRSDLAAKPQKGDSDAD